MQDEEDEQIDEGTEDTDTNESKLITSYNFPARTQPQDKPPLLSKKSQLAMRNLKRAQKYLQDHSIIDEIKEVFGKGSYNLIKYLGKKSSNKNEAQATGKGDKSP